MPEIIQKAKMLLDALDKLDAGCTRPGFSGHENGFGENVGDEVEIARQELRKLVG